MSVTDEALGRVSYDQLMSDIGPAWAEFIRLGRLRRGQAPELEFTGPYDGFGQLWHKVYTVDLPGDRTPAEVIRLWKAHFTDLWPEGNDFYMPLRGIRPGEIADIEVQLGPGVKLSTDLLIVQSDATAFTFVTPRKHMFAGWINFSASAAGGGSITRAQVQALIRPGDPLFEISFRLGIGHLAEDRFWFGTLRNLSKFLGVDREPYLVRRRLDGRVQWSKAGNLRHNPIFTPARRLFGGARQANTARKNDGSIRL